MGVLLRGEAGEFVLNNRGWATLLRLAWDYGWRPKGTVRPDLWSDRPWNPADYVTCRGQRVRREDAAALAEALETILDDLPNHDPLAGEPVERVEAPGLPPVRYSSTDRLINTFELLGGENKPHLERFITFCRRGSFAIW